MNSGHQNRKVNLWAGTDSQAKANHLLLFAGVSGFIVVVSGAFGAHYLQSLLSERLMQAFLSGVQYQAWHTLVLITCAILMKMAPSGAAQKGFYWAGLCFIGGIVCFSGSLYALALTGVKWFGPITPFGGVLFLFGWGIFSYAAYQIKEVRS